MFPPADTAWTVLAALRDAVAGFYDSNVVDLPARRLVTPGLPAWDCEQMTVSLVSSYNHTGNMAAPIFEQQHGKAAWSMRALVVDVAVTRCVATLDDSGKAPTVDQIEANAQALAVDEQMLRLAVDDAVTTGKLPGCNTVLFETFSVINPQGGFAGGVLRLRVSP